MADLDAYLTCTWVTERYCILFSIMRWHFAVWPKLQYVLFKWRLRANKSRRWGRGVREQRDAWVQRPQGFQVNIPPHSLLSRSCFSNHARRLKRAFQFRSEHSLSGLGAQKLCTVKKQGWTIHICLPWWKAMMRDGAALREALEDR